MFLILIGLLTFVIAAEVAKDIKPANSPPAAEKPTAATASQAPTPAASDDTMKGCYESGINPRVLCVKCYEKFRTKDCQTCTCKCSGGTEYTTAAKGDDGTEMANRDDIPCACRDKCGNFDPNATYQKTK